MKRKTEALLSEGEAILQAIRRGQLQMECARSAFETVRSCIGETAGETAGGDFSAFSDEALRRILEESDREEG